MKYRAPLILLFFFCIVSNASPLSQDIKEELARLDAILNESQFYTREHRQKIEGISEGLMSGEMDDRHRFEHYRNLYDVCVTYNFDKAFYITLNLAWGGSWGNYAGVDESALPCTMKVDYVRVFQK